MNSSPKAHRYLFLDPPSSHQVGLGPLVAKEAEMFEEHTPISISRNSEQCALFGERMALVHEKYPALSSRVVSSPSVQNVCWFEILSPVLIYDASL